MQSHDEPLTVKDLERHYHQEERTIREWAAKGKLPGAFKTPGGHWRFPSSVLEWRGPNGAESPDEPPVALPLSSEIGGQLSEPVSANLHASPHAEPDGMYQVSPLALKIVSCEISKPHVSRWTGLSVSILPTVEVTATEYVQVTCLVLVLGGKQIEEYRNRERELLGREEWYPHFPVPKWVQPGTYNVHVRALHWPEGYRNHLLYQLNPSAYEEQYVTIGESNHVELCVPESLRRARARDEARRHARAEAMASMSIPRSIGH